MWTGRRGDQWGREAGSGVDRKALGGQRTVVLSGEARGQCCGQGTEVLNEEGAGAVVPSGRLNTWLMLYYFLGF